MKDKTYKEKNWCNSCHIAFDKMFGNCPKCGRTVIRRYDMVKQYNDNEGEGRMYRVGGAACDYCSHCEGNAHWCPFMDD